MNSRPSARLLLVLSGIFLGCGGPPREPASLALMAPHPPDRGQYLALHVSLCLFCHSEIDWKAEGFPPLEGTVGGGRSPFSEALPWLPAPNLSPDRDTGAGRWTEEQLTRAVRQGIGADGRTLHPAMPYGSYHVMTDDDAASLVDYLRSLPPVRKSLPAPRYPDEIQSRLRPLPPPRKEPSSDRSTPAKRGEYLVSLAICGHCHTPVDDRGKPVPGMEFAGGTRLKGPWGDLHTPNITPDFSGIECIDEKTFVHAMKTGQLPGHTLNAVMPWGYYRHMTDEDLHSIYAYLSTIKPVRHFIDNGVAPTPCRKCGRPHGLGSKND